MNGGATSLVRWRLYIMAGTARSDAALTKVRRILKEMGDGQVDLEIVDVAKEPLRALSDGVLIIPTLMRLTPPLGYLVGDLGDADATLQALTAPPRH